MVGWTRKVTKTGGVAGSSGRHRTVKLLTKLKYVDQSQPFSYLNVYVSYSESLYFLYIFIEECFSRPHNGKWLKLMKIL